MRGLGQHGQTGGAAGAAGVALSAGEIQAMTEAVAAADLAGLTDTQRIDFLRAAEELKSALEGAQAEVAVAFDASQRAGQARAGVPAERQARGVAAQIALARRVSHHRGARLLHLAHRLRDMPETRAALRAGRITEHRAGIIARDSECLSPELRARVDLAVAGDPDWLETLGDRRLEAEVQRLAYRFDPQSFVKRSSQAAKDRRVTSRPAPDTMMRLGALLPVVQGVAVYAALRHWAEAQNAAGDPRSIGQLMADRLVELVTGQVQADQVPIRADIVLADSTLLGRDQEPGWVQDYGPIPADIARQLILDAHGLGPAALRRLYAHPETGRLVAMESRSRDFPDGLAELIRLRDQGWCRGGWCDAPIRDSDHVRSVAESGRTTFVNGQGTCEACNIAKEAIGWTARPRPGPAGQHDLHTVETTTPTGHVYTSVAPQVRVVRRPLAMEIHLDESLTAA